jgi:hypothetical protein
MTALPAKTAFTAENLTEGDFRAAMDNLRDYLSERVQGLKSNTALSDAAATLTAAQLVGGEFTITPTVARTQTTDTAVNIIAAMAGSADGSSFEFTVINLADFAVTIALGTGVTLVGDMAVNIGAATFRVRRLTSTTVSVTRLESQFTAAAHAKLDTLSAPIAVATNHIRLGREYLTDGTFIPSFADIDATATAGTFRTYGKTGASTVIDDMDTYLPAGATGVILDVTMELISQQDENTRAYLYACRGDLSPSADTGNLVGYAKLSNTGGSGFYENGRITRIIVPITSSGIFKSTFTYFGTVPAITLRYRGYVTN